MPDPMTDQTVIAVQMYMTMKHAVKEVERLANGSAIGHGINDFVNSLAYQHLSIMVDKFERLGDVPMTVHEVAVKLRQIGAIDSASINIHAYPMSPRQASVAASAAEWQRSVHETGCTFFGLLATAKDAVDHNAAKIESDQVRKLALKMIEDGFDNDDSGAVSIGALVERSVISTATVKRIGARACRLANKMGHRDDYSIRVAHGIVITEDSDQSGL